MKRFGLLSLGVLLATCQSALAAGMAHNENFIVLGPDRPLANQVLTQADQFRKSVALEWFGAEMETGEGRAIIHLELSSTCDLGLIWRIDCPERKFHRVWLVTSADRAVGSTLHHEIAHVVLATRLPNRLPWWADEGIASQYDDYTRKQTRESILAQFGQSGTWPTIDEVIAGKKFAPDNEEAYAIAVSITDYLLARGDRGTFLAFAGDGKSKGWNAALQEHYGLASLQELESAWRAWFRQPNLQARQDGGGRIRPMANLSRLVIERAQ